MHPTIGKYLQVIKPGLVIGNLISVAGGFFLAARGDVDPMLLLATAVGTSLVVASGCVFNNRIDRSIDRRMARTRHRALARGDMSATVAVTYATGLGIGGLVLLWAFTNPLCVAIVAAGFIVYVVAYSLWLKRTSVYSTLVGSLAGAAPPLVGYCAVTHRFDLGAVILLAIFSLWQIPHSYAIAVFRLKDYASAAIPVLPVVRGIPTAKRHIVAHVLAFQMATLMLTFAGYTGYGFLAAATAIGLTWLGLAWSGGRIADDQRWAKWLFIFSVVSITALSVMMAIDVTLPPAPVALLNQAP